MTREELERRVTLVRQELEEAANGRYPVPKLIAVTKTHSAEEILLLMTEFLQLSLVMLLQTSWLKNALVILLQ